MKIDLKILLVILAVVLLLGLLEAEPSSRRRSSSSTSRRRSYSSSRRRTSSYSRRRRSSSNGSSQSSSESSTSTAIVVVIVVVVFAVAAIIFICYVCFVFRRQRDGRQEFEHEIRELDTQTSSLKPGPQDGLKTDEESSNETNPALNTAFDNAGVDAAPLLPYPPGVSDQNPAYPQTSLPYPPQESIYPPNEVTNGPPYPPQSTSIAYPPERTGEEEPGVHQQTWPGQAQDESTASAPPMQYGSGNDLPPPPAYDDIEMKKNL